MPHWQKLVVRAMYPLLVRLVQRTFSLTDATFQRATLAIEELLHDMETALSDGRKSILAGERNFTDFAFAAFSGAWLFPAGYAAGKAEHERIDTGVMPPGMRDDVLRWREDYPRVAAWVESLYEKERMPG